MHAFSITKHFGHPVIVENKPIKLVKIPVKGERLHESVLLHPRYAPRRRGIDYEIIFVTGRRRGRCIDVLLDEPLEIGGKTVTVLNFKGVGADADRSMVIHPTLWYETEDGKSKWLGRKKGDVFVRMWGALQRTDGIIEFHASGWQELNLPYAPHIALNEVPNNASRYISEIEQRKKWSRISQLVRGFSTNIRLESISSLENTPFIGYVDSRRFGEIDAVLINNLLKLAAKGKMLVFIGRIIENRTIDGNVTDAENYAIGPFGPNKTADTIGTFIMDMAEKLPDKSGYLTALEEKTGIGFTAMLDPSALVRIPFTSFHLLVNNAVQSAAGEQ